MVGNSGPGFPNKKPFKTGFEAWKGKISLQYSHTGEGVDYLKGYKEIVLKAFNLCMFLINNHCHMTHFKSERQLFYRILKVGGILSGDF